MKICIRGFKEGKNTFYRIYNNQKDYEEHWDQGIGIYKNEEELSEKLQRMGELELISFDLANSSQEEIERKGRQIQRLIEEHNPDNDIS